MKIRVTRFNIIQVLPAGGKRALLPQADPRPERGPLRGRGAGQGRGGDLLGEEVLLRR